MLPHTPLLHYLAVGLLPSCTALQQVTEFASSSEPGPSSRACPMEFCIGAGLPPIPPRLVTRIESGEFIEMAELVPDNSATSTATQSRPNKSQRRAISNIFEWVKCFSMYIAVVSLKQPHRVPDLLGYLILIMESHVEHAGEGWIGYDRRFREIAATKPNVVWAQIDTTLWNIAFSGKATSARCKFCFSLFHTSAECSWAPQQGSPPSGYQHLQQTPTQPSQYSRPLRRRRICMLYNNEPAPGCSFPDCRFDHICCLCADDPRATDKCHKAIMCPHHSNLPPPNREPPKKWQPPMLYRKQQQHPHYR